METLPIFWSGQWMLCGAWERIAGSFVGVEESPSLASQDTAHKLLDEALSTGIGPCDTIPDDIEKPKLTDAHCAQIAFSYCHKTWNEMGLDDTTLLPFMPAEVTAGERTLTALVPVAIYNSEVLEIVDLRTGPGTFIDERNESYLKLYALATMATQGIAPPAVKLTVIQPRYWGNEPTIRTLELTPGDLTDWLSCAVIPASDKNNATSPGTVTERCKRCPGRHVCEFRDREVAHAIGGDGHMTTHEVVQSDIISTRDKTIYDNAKLAQTLLLVPVIRDYCDALESHAHDIIMNGENVPGFKVVGTSGHKKWANEDAVKEALHKTKVAKSAFTQKLKTPGQVLKLGPSANLKKTLEGLIVSGSGGTKLVLDSEDGESIAPAFEVLEQQPIEAAAPAPAPVALPDFLM